MSSQIRRPANLNLRIQVKPGQRRGSTKVLRSPGLIPRVIVEANLGAKGKSTYKKVNEQKYRFFHLPTRDLEGVPTGELEEVPTSTRTTGR